MANFQNTALIRTIVAMVLYISYVSCPYENKTKDKTLQKKMKKENEKMGYVTHKIIITQQTAQRNTSSLGADWLPYRIRLH